MRRRAASLVLLALVLVYAATASSYGPASRAMPLAVCGVTILLLLLDMLSQGEGRAATLVRRALGGAQARRPGDEGAPAPLRHELGAFAWIVGFLVLAILLGFYIAIPVYIFGYLRLYAGKPLVASVAVALALVALLYASFELLLGYQIFEGLVFGGYL